MDNENESENESKSVAYKTLCCSVRYIQETAVFLDTTRIFQIVHVICQHNGLEIVNSFHGTNRHYYSLSGSGVLSVLLFPERRTLMLDLFAELSDDAMAMIHGFLTESLSSGFYTSRYDIVKRTT
jgi:hypothetical protein